jgi:hypothetical protein
MNKGKLVLCGEDALPKREVNGFDIDSTFKELLGDICVDCQSVRYIGYFDKEKSRQYNFRIDIETQLKSPRLRLFEVNDALELLNVEEADAVRRALVMATDASLAQQ